jgi:ferredoxin-nitrate reductase
VTYHFHTRTKTGRAAALQAAAPEPIVEIHRADAEKLGIADGDIVEVASRRGTANGIARLTGIEPGVVFMPFHYGDEGDESGRQPTAANRLTITGWDLVSKQPFFKYAAVSVRPVAPAGERPRAGDSTVLAGRHDDRRRRELVPGEERR